jgi:DNA-binding NarL/FixJ family response regulator
MLETVRQYGDAQLDDQSRLRLRERHRDHYRALAERYGAEGFGPRQAEWFIRLRREHGNVRAAVEFCLEDPARAHGVFQIAAPMWNFWFAGFLREGYRYLLRALELAPEQTADRAHALWAASYLAMFATEFERNAAMLAECEQIAAELHDPLLDARIKECRGHATLYQGDLPRAVSILEEACAAFRAIGDGLGEFDTLILLTAAALFRDDDRIDEHSHDALALAERHGALSSKGYGLWSVGVARWRSGDYQSAVKHLRESIEVFSTMHDLTGISFGVQALSWCAASQAPDVRAAQMLGASQAVWRTSGARVDETNAYGMFDTRAEDAVRAALGTEKYDAAFGEGASYSFDEAVGLALGKLGRDGIADRSAREQGKATGKAGGKAAGTKTLGRAPGGLTRREMEIALLLADGMSNREIADRLVISLRTAETHVDHILGKLGLSSRAGVASWVAEHATE